MTRLTPLTDRSELSTEQRAEWDVIFNGLGRVRGPFGLMLRQPGLARAFYHLVERSHDTSIVSDAHHEFVILLVASEENAPYQWSAHIEQARSCGLTEAAIEAARQRGELDALDDGERDIALITRQLCRTDTVDGDLFASLLERYGPSWMMLIITTIGLYRCVATFNNAFDVDPLPGADQLF